MNSRERILTTIEHKEPDRIPFSCGDGTCCLFTKKFYENLLKYLGMKDDHIMVVDKATQVVFAKEEVLKKLGIDVRTGGLIPKGPLKNTIAEDWEDEKSLYFRDEWNIVRRMPKDPGYYYDIIHSPMDGKEEEEDADMHWPDLPDVDPIKTVMYNKYIRDNGNCNMFGSHYAISTFTWGMRIFGFGQWLEMLALEPERVNRFLTKLVDRKLEYWKLVFDTCGEYIDIATVMDDMGTQKGPWISTEMYKKLIFPHHKRLFQGIKSMKPGMQLFIHTCGSIAPVIPYLIEAGIDILNPVQISAQNMDPYMLKREFGKDLTFWGGGIDTQYVLPHGTKQEIIDNVKRNIDAFAPGGGFVFATVHDVQPDVPPENYMLMHETFMKYANY